MEILLHLTARTPLSPDISLARLAQQTSGLSFAELRALVTQAQRAAILRMRKDVLALRGPICERVIEAKDLCIAGVCVNANEFDEALKGLQKSQSALFGTPHIPNVAWEDIGGLVEAKVDILDTIQVMIEGK